MFGSCSSELDGEILPWRLGIYYVAYSLLLRTEFISAVTTVHNFLCKIDVCGSGGELLSIFCSRLLVAK